MKEGLNGAEEREKHTEEKRKKRANREANWGVTRER